jgi:site-specific recombinase XerD
MEKLAEPLNIPSDAAVVKSTDIYEFFHSRRDGKLIVIVSRGPSGKRIESPVTAYVNAYPSKITEMVVDYVVVSLSTRYPNLIKTFLENSSTLKLAEYLYRRRSRSSKTLQLYAYFISRFSEWIGKTPDQLINECFNQDGLRNEKAIVETEKLIDTWLGELESHGLSWNSLSLARASLKTFYDVNGVNLRIPKAGRSIVTYHDRAPTPEELQKLLEIADLRGKVIVSMLALGGFRIGTLAKLKYRHVKHDLERGIVPVHIHVEASITKGKYHDYDTFIGAEAVEYLKLYFEQRRRGTEKIPPETIMDESPLIRAYSREVKPLTESQIYCIVHDLYVKAGLCSKIGGSMYDLRVHSIRKYFRTQLSALGVPSDYIEYMMGHTISTYHDIKMKGVEFLRNVYASSGLSIKPKTRVSKLEILKEFARLLGLNPEEVIVREALSKSWRTIMAPNEIAEEQIEILQERIRSLLGIHREQLAFGSR